MQVTGSAGASAALMLQRLLRSDDSTSSSSQQELQGAGQSLPGVSNVSTQGGGVAGLSDATLSVAITLQAEGSSSPTAPPAPPTGEDIAKGLINQLDTNGDGEVSTDEITAAFKNAGVDADSSSVSDAVKKLDTDGNGSLSATELGSAIDTQMKAHKGHGHHGGHHGGGGEGGPPGGGSTPSSSSVASSLLSSLDTDDSSGLSLSEILTGIGQTDQATSDQTSTFASLDTNGDGSLDANELSSAISNMMKQDMAAYAQSAYSQSASLTAAA